MSTTWRPARPDDAASIAALLNASTELAGSHELTTARSVREELEGPFWNLELDTVVAEREATIAAFGGVIAPPPGGTTLRSRAAVHPEHRGLGIGTGLLGRLVRRAREQRAASGATEPWSLRQGSEDGDPSAGELLAAHGFAPERFWFEMERDVEDVAQPSELDGLVVRDVAADDTEALYAAHEAAFADHWGSQNRGFDSFLTRVANASSFRPALSRIAVDDHATVAGYALAFVEADPAQVHFGLIGTRREWRGRGVASALVRSSLIAARLAGVTSAALLVDGDSPTGAVGVYERLGFAVVGRATTYALTLS